MNTTKHKSLADRIIGASLVVGAAHILLKLTGFIQVKFAAYFLDSSVYEPVMVVAPESSTSSSSEKKSSGRPS